MILVWSWKNIKPSIFVRTKQWESWFDTKGGKQSPKDTKYLVNPLQHQTKESWPKDNATGIN